MAEGRNGHPQQCVKQHWRPTSVKHSLAEVAAGPIRSDLEPANCKVKTGRRTSNANARVDDHLEINAAAMRSGKYDIMGTLWHGQSNSYTYFSGLRQKREDMRATKRRIAQLYVATGCRPSAERKRP